MKPYLIGFLIMAMPVAALQGTTNMSDKTAEYLNPGESIHVKIGRIFTIMLESNPTTGYAWQLSKALDKKISLVTNAFIPPDRKLCGAGGHEVWTFKAVESGQANVFMKYVRPWDPNQPARTNLFTVIVQ